mmetsp:Transcript_62359/g.92630  ORF Transcript_62359/g.92630 Transcript_62359/m.92630 type:complete len:268 (-) Transcript_62359:362-1165(-)
MFLLMEQAQICWSSEDPNGQAGFECIHCSTEKNPFQIFPSSSRRLHGTLRCLHDHMVLRCNKCPSTITATLLEKEKMQTSQYTHLKPTAQAEFLDHIWKRLLDAKNIPKHSISLTVEEPMASGKSLSAEHSETNQPEKEVKKHFTKRRYVRKLVKIGDKELVTEYVFYLMSQMRPCYESSDSSRGGFECIHCCNEEEKFQVFPTSVRRLGGYLRHIHHHLAKDCRKAPKELLETLLSLEKLHISQYARSKPYGQSEFFERIWERLQC